MKQDLETKQLYNCYRQIRNSLINPRAPNYHNCGGRGLTSDWDTFRDFERDILAHLGPKPPGKILLRKDFNKGWTLKNLEWGTKQIQGDRLDSTIWITYRRRKKKLTTWCRELGVSIWTARDRYRKGLSPREILTKGNL